MSSSVAILLATSVYRVLNSCNHDITNEYMVSDMVVSSVTQNIQELNNEPSLFVIVFVQVAY